MRPGLRDMHRLQELVRLHREGFGAVQCAAMLNIDRKTERKYRTRIREKGLLDGPSDDLPELYTLRVAVVDPSTPPSQEQSSVRDWARFIDDKRKAGLGPTAIHAILVEEANGFSGSLSAVKRLYRRLKAVGDPVEGDVVIPIVTPAGQQAQVDFGYVGKLVDPDSGMLRKAWVFVMVLSHSRHMYAEVVFDQSAETWVKLHINAFKAFGGVPAVVVPDNLKAAVIRAVFKADEMGELNRTYRDLARHYGFVVDPTPAYSPEKKGKVESAVKYVKNAFFAPRTFPDVANANTRLAVWVRDAAGQRTHGTTGRKPLRVFDEVERPALKKLPVVPYVPVAWYRASIRKNSHVAFQGRFYSVPWKHLGKTAWLKVFGDSVVAYVEDVRVAEHVRSGETQWSTDPSHLPSGRQHFAERDPNHWYGRADAIHADVGAFIRDVMASDDVAYPLRRVQAMVPLLEGLTSERAVSVCSHAARFGNYRPDSLRRIVANGPDLDQVSDGFVSVEWASSPRYARDAEEFLERVEVTRGNC